MTIEALKVGPGHTFPTSFQVQCAWDFGELQQRKATRPSKSKFQLVLDTQKKKRVSFKMGLIVSAAAAAAVGVIVDKTSFCSQYRRRPCLAFETCSCPTCCPTGFHNRFNMKMYMMTINKRGMA